MAAPTDELSRYLLRLPSAVRRELSRTLANESGRVAREIKEVAPVGVEGDTGELRESVQSVRLSELDYEVTVGGELTTIAGYDYAMAVEFGTTKMAARPFVYPTWNRLRPSVEKNIQEAVDKAINA